MRATSFHISAIVVATLLGGPGLAAQQDDIDRRLDALARNAEHVPADERLRELYDVYLAWFVDRHPEVATFFGYPAATDRWTDYSAGAIAYRADVYRRLLEIARAIDRDALGAARHLDYDLLRRHLEDAVAGVQFDLAPPFGAPVSMPVNQMGGVQQTVPQVLALMPTRTVDDYLDILLRLRRVPALVDQTIALLRDGLERGFTPPRITLRDVPEQVQNLLTDDPAESPLLVPFQRPPPRALADTVAALSREATRVVTDHVYPAYRRLHRYLVETYVPAARTSIATSALPDGEARYAHQVRRHTTTPLSAREIHEIGLAEVARIRREMAAVIEATGFEGGFAEFLDFLRTDPQFFFEDADALLTAYRDIAKRADPEVTRLFGTLPRLPYGVKAVPAYAERSQTTAYYQPGSPEAGRPGYFYANTYDLASRPKWEMEALTLHEAVPGHHLQIAIAQELEDVPELRRFLFYTAFIEGWGLYAESLGHEMGFYQDPYAQFGQLTYELWRAIRLVVDTGMHALGWSRRQAIDYFMENAGKAEHDIIVEVDRYIVWPGQALAYKIGELKIKELRAYAERELGDPFDIRAFHDAVLGHGALPLDLLEARIRSWVEEVRPLP